MKHILILLFSVVLFTSCSNDDCESEARTLEQQYENAVNNASGNPEAIREIRNQYESAKSRLKC